MEIMIEIIKLLRELIVFGTAIIVLLKSIKDD